MYEESQGDPRVHWSMHAALQHVAYIEQHEDLFSHCVHSVICAIVKCAIVQLAQL